MECMKNDSISMPQNIQLLRKQVQRYSKDMSFKQSKNMGEILDGVLDFVKRNYEKVKNELNCFFLGS